MSNRKVTNQQFSEGTTVDGERLDSALQNTEDIINSVSGGDLETRYTQTQIVAGWTAYQKTSQEFQAPWLRFQNTTSDRQGTTGDIAHPFRVKGTKTAGFGIWAAPEDPTTWIWTTSIYLEDPCIIDALDMMWQKWTGATFVTNVNPQLDFVGAADFLTTGSIHCTVTVADPQNTETPLRNSLVVQLRDVYMGAETLSTDPAIFPLSATNMAPTVPVSGMPSFPATLAANQLWYQRRNMQVHIPANSRVSFSIALPGHDGAGNKLDYDSYMRGSPNLVITLLEPIRK